MTTSRKQLILGRDRVAAARSRKSFNPQAYQMQLLRAACLAQWHLKWWDGFLIFPSWRLEQGKKSYPDMWSTNLQRTMSRLAREIIGEGKLGRYSERHTVWASYFGEALQPTSNLGLFMERLEAAPQLKGLTEQRGKWIVGLVAMDCWPHDCKQLLRPLSGPCPDVDSALEDWFTCPRELLAECINTVKEAAAHVASVIRAGRPSREEREDINDALSEWLRCLAEYHLLLASTPPDQKWTRTSFPSVLDTLAAELKRISDSGGSASDEAEACVAQAFDTAGVEETLKEVFEDLIDNYGLRKAIKREVGTYFTFAFHWYATQNPADIHRHKDFRRTFRDTVIAANTTRHDSGATRHRQEGFDAALETLNARLSTADFTTWIRSEQQADSGHVNDVVQELIGPQSVSVQVSALAQPIISPSASARVVSGSTNLHLITDILGTDNEEPRWFRRSGPRLTDLKHNCVHVPVAKVREIREALLAAPFLLLEGPPAAGKSVLARLVAYQLWVDQQEPVYFVYPNTFDPAELASAIKQIQGVIIIENLHLRRKAHFALYTLLRGNMQHKHILWTTRPIANDLGTDIEELADLPRLTADISDSASEIADAYLRSLKHHPLGDEDRSRAASDIAASAAGNLWLLAYGLEGYARKNGEGSVEDWVKAGVRSELRALEARHAQLPRLAVAVSCLYRYEVPTAENYLTDALGFSYDDLKTGVNYGYLTRTEDDGEFCYGLHHSESAEMYWRHGRRYRPSKMRTSYREILADYAQHRSPNTVRAFWTWTGPLSERAVRLLQDPGFLAWLLRKGIRLWELCELCTRCRRPFNPHQCQALADAFARTDDARDIWDYMTMLIWIPSDLRSGVQLDPAHLAETLSRESDIRVIRDLLVEVNISDCVDLRILARHLDCSALLRTMDNADAPDAVLEALAALHGIHAETAGLIWRTLNRRQLVHSYEQLTPVRLMDSIGKVSGASPEFIGKVCACTAFTRLALQCVYPQEDPMPVLSGDGPPNVGLERVRLLRDCKRLSRMIRGACLLSRAGAELVSTVDIKSTSLACPSPATEGLPGVYGYEAVCANDLILISRTVDPLKDVCRMPSFSPFLEAHWLPGVTAAEDPTLSEQDRQACWGRYFYCPDDSLMNIYWDTLVGKRQISDTTIGMVRMRPGTLPFSIAEDRVSIKGSDSREPCHVVGSVEAHALVMCLYDVSRVKDACIAWSWIRCIGTRATREQIAKRTDIERLAETVLQACSVTELLDLWQCRALRLREDLDLLQISKPHAIARMLDQDNNRTAAKELAILIASRYRDSAESLMGHLQMPDVKEEVRPILRSSPSDYGGFGFGVHNRKPDPQWVKQAYNFDTEAMWEQLSQDDIY